MKFKGTKGKWRIKYGNYENGRGVFSITTHTTNIATIWSAVEEKETTPNAKLIAAAPELLEACFMAREELEFGGDWVNAKIVINKAIEKALK